MDNTIASAWPALPYNHFKSTAYLLHMVIQAIGKLKLTTPFEPHWSNTSLHLTSRGISTGLIPYQTGGFAIHVDLIDHMIICTTTWGKVDKFNITSMSVAALTGILFNTLDHIGVEVSINPKPQEVPHPIPFHVDTEMRTYDAELANAWWSILVSSYGVMLKFHSYFLGITPAIGLMWGTLDLRDVRYLTQRIPTTGANAGYIRRNAMDVPQFEIGWWHGNETYQKPAYYAFIYPGLSEAETLKIKPNTAKWNKELGEFLLDYDDLRQAKQPEKELFLFFESTYQALSERAGWDKALNCQGEPA